MTIAVATTALLASGALAADAGAQGWTSFRGPGARGVADRASPPLAWSAKEGTHILWKTPVPSHGMSSPVVWGKRLFLTGADEAARRLYCYDAETGRLLWQHDMDGLPGFPRGSALPEVLEQTGWAAPTVTTNGRQVAALFATGELVVVDMAGERVWARHLGVPKNHYGHSSSLMSHENLLFVQLDQEVDSKLLAFDLASGEAAWQASRDVISWSSPILVDNRGRMELVLTNSRAVDGYDPRTGERLWRVECLSGEVASSAAYADGIVFVSSENAGLTAIDIGEHGAPPRIVWRWDDALPDAASPLAKDGLVILPTGFGVVSCLDARTGKLHWQEEFDRGFWSSPVLAGDRVYLTDLSGTTHVFRLDDEFELLGASEIGEAAYATPAFVGDRVYIRGLTHLFCAAARPR